MNYRLAFALGLIAPGTVWKEPVAYMYGQLRAPKLPEHSTHPYVVIEYNKLTEKIVVNLYFMKTLTQTLQSVYGYERDAIWRQPGDISYEFTKYGLNLNIQNITVSDWGEPKVLTESEWGFADSGLLWANTDIESMGSYIQEAGTVIIAKSDPIPVYE